jgi:hypothetical protein
VKSGAMPVEAGKMNLKWVDFWTVAFDQ